jgi:hypothetical protein
MKNEKAEDIVDSLTCLICASKIKEPLMCPFCKKLMCSQCLKKWFEQNHEKCPYCQKAASYHDMINLPFMNQLSDYFMQQIDNEQKEEEKGQQDNEENEENEPEDEKEKNNIEENNNKDSFNQIIEVEEDEIDEKIKKKPLSRTEYNQNNFQINKSNNYSEIKKQGLLCPKHNDIIEYYCLNCNTNHCANCLNVLNKEHEIHKYHKIIDYEEKKKYNFDEAKKNINNLSPSIQKLEEYKQNLKNEIMVRDKIVDFYKIIFESLGKYFNDTNKNKNESLESKINAIDEQLTKLNHIKDTYENSFTNFIEQDDKEGFKNFIEKIKNEQNVDRFKTSEKIPIFFKPLVHFYESEFLDIPVDLSDEIVGEYTLKFDGLDFDIHIKFQSQAEDEILVSLFIKLEQLDEKKEKYYGYIITKNGNEVTAGTLDERMYTDATLILGRTLRREGFMSIIDNNNQCHIKVVFLYCSFLQ